MMSMQDLGNLGELIAAIATLGTLVYLAIQIRQNTKQVEEATRAARASAVSAGLHLINTNRLAIYSDRETTEIWSKGLEDPKSLDPNDLLRFRMICSNALEAQFNNYSQTKDAGYSPELWEAHITTTRRILASPGGRWFWENFREEFRKDFRDEVDRLLTADV